MSRNPFFVIYAFFGLNFILRKFCPCKINDKYEVWKVPSENISSRSEEEIFEQEQEGDIEETDLEQKEAKIQKSVQNKRARNLKQQENFIDED